MAEITKILTMQSAAMKFVNVVGTFFFLKKCYGQLFLYIYYYKENQNWLTIQKLLQLCIIIKLLNLFIIHYYTKFNSTFTRSK